MEPKFNFILNPIGNLSKHCITLGLTNFITTCNYIKRLPYGRNSDRSNYNLVLKENKGTCATKHAFLKQIALENNKEDIKLYIGIYKMNESNTKGTGKVLEKNSLSYIPEAHTYLKYKGEVFDFTREQKSHSNFIKDLLYEEEILPKQIGAYKINLHESYLKKWVKTENIGNNFNEVWRIREACIAALKE